MSRDREALATMFRCKQPGVDPEQWPPHQWGGWKPDGHYFRRTCGRCGKWELVRPADMVADEPPPPVEQGEVEVREELEAMGQMRICE